MRPLLALLFLASAVTCIPLERLCSEDHFEYMGFQVNAIYRLKINVTLESVSNFTVPVSAEENCLNHQWYYLANKQQAEAIKNSYNNLVIRLYSDRFLNSKDANSSTLSSRWRSTDELLQKMVKIRQQESGYYLAACLDGKFLASMKNGSELISHLVSLYGGEFPQTDEQALSLGKGPAFKRLESEMAEIADNLTDSQTMAFQYDLFHEVYKKRIIQMSKFVFHKKSKLVYDLNSHGVVHYDIVFPFEDTKLRAGKKCVSLADLPEFFASRKPVNTTPSGA